MHALLTLYSINQFFIIIIVPSQPVITSISNVTESTTTDSIIVYWTLGYNLVSHIFVILHNKLAPFLFTAMHRADTVITNLSLLAIFRVMTLLYLILPSH